MDNRFVYGYEGDSHKLYLYRHNVLFATAKSFTATITDFSSGGHVYGYKVQLILNALTITDKVGVKEMLYAMQEKEGGVAFDFEGVMTRPNNRQERIELRQCIPIGPFDIAGMSEGFMKVLALTVNFVPEETQKILGIF